MSDLVVEDDPAPPPYTSSVTSTHFHGEFPSYLANPLAKSITVEDTTPIHAPPPPKADKPKRGRPKKEKEEPPIAAPVSAQPQITQEQLKKKIEADLSGLFNNPVFAAMTNEKNKAEPDAFEMEKQSQISYLLKNRAVLDRVLQYGDYAQLALMPTAELAQLCSKATLYMSNINTCGDMLFMFYIKGIRFIGGLSQLPARMQANGKQVPDWMMFLTLLQLEGPVTNIPDTLEQDEGYKALFIQVCAKLIPLQWIMSGIAVELQFLLSTIAIVGLGLSVNIAAITESAKMMEEESLD